MPVADMKKIYISALKRDKQRLVEYLQRLETVELEEYDSSSSRIFSAKDFSADVDGLLAKYSRTNRAMDILDEYSTEKASMFAALEGKQIKTVPEYDAFKSDFDTALSIADSICDVEDGIRGAKDYIAKLNDKIESLRPWSDLQVPLGFSGTTHTSVLIGSLPQGYTLWTLEGAIAELGYDPGKYVLHIVSSCKEQTCLMAAAMKRDKKELETLLERLQFSPPPVMTDKEPGREIELLADMVNEKKDSLNTLKQALEQLASHKKQIRFLLDHLAIVIEGHKAYSQIGEADYALLITGYIPAKRFERVKAELEKGFKCAIYADDVTDSDDVPTLMENSRFSQPLESVVASYNYPRYKELDPTKITSFFYYFMFGLMFSDAAYGALLALTCGGLLIKFKHMNEQTGKFLRLFFWCGISTLAWGIVFSSYFGDVVDVFSAAYLGGRVSIPPLWFAPLEEPMRLLLFCLAIGIVHLTVGYGVNLYSALRSGDVKGAVYDSVMPVALLFSLLAVFMGTEMFGGLAGFTVSIGAMASNICLSAAGVCAVGILLTSGRESKNWIKRLLKGAFGLYNVLAGWVSDILSYSRLLALGLATGVIGSVINTLAAMAGKGVVGIVIFLIIFVVGHVMNFGINILGSYVHSNRLEYVEFFGKFYEGGGRAFRPLGLNTKYYTIREENQ